MLGRDHGQDIAGATGGQKKSGEPRPRHLSFRLIFERLSVVEFARHFVEGAAQAVTDVAHSSNRGNGDESGNQAVLNGGRTLSFLISFRNLAISGLLQAPQKGSTIPYLRN